MPALQPSLIEPIWEQFSALPPERETNHPLGCHQSPIPDRVVFEKLVQVLVFGCAYERIADECCSATTLRRRRDEWIEAGVMITLRKLALEAYDKLIGLQQLSDVAVACCITKAACAGEEAGRNRVDRGKQGIKRSALVDANGIQLGAVAAPTNRHDSPLLDETLGTLAVLGELPEQMSVHLDRGYDSRITTEKLSLPRVFGLSMGKMKSRRADLKTAYPCSSYEFACTRVLGRPTASGNCACLGGFR